MKIFGDEPAVILYALNSAVALVVSFGLPLNGDQVGAITVISTAALTVWTAIYTRPVVVSVITGAVGTVLVAVGAFGFDLTANQQGAAVTALSVALSLLLRQAVTPTAVTPTAVSPVESPGRRRTAL
ncbi:MAG: hypothetical protein ABIS86_05460 [Streptosporangiaceae bacterium]